MELLSTRSLVESPFVIVKIGEYTFGAFTKKQTVDKYGTKAKVTFPNFTKSISTTKVNGEVNTYTIAMEYGITQYDDPNLLEKVFASVADTRRLTLSYGDWNSPSFIYKEEQALITRVQSSVNFRNSSIQYTIDCVSDTIGLKSATFSFGPRKAKPSDVIKEMLKNKTYGLVDIFYGMSDYNKVIKEGLILSNDRVVDIPGRKDITVLDYLNYLVNSMITNSYTYDVQTNQKLTTRYYLNIRDDIGGKFNGPYFEIIQVGTDAQFTTDPDVFTLDIGFPTNNLVTNFQILSNETWSILYKYSNTINQNNYVYKIDNNGNMTRNFVNNISKNTAMAKTTPADKTWWAQVTEYPITAQVTIRGLLRPAILMNYVKVNTLMYGRKYIASGLYIITRQEDLINSEGYKTTLSLTRIGADEVV